MYKTADDDVTALLRSGADELSSTSIVVSFKEKCFARVSGE